MHDETRTKIPISANWIRERIKKGKNIRLRNVIIKGNLKVSDLGLPEEPVERIDYQRLLRENKLIFTPKLQEDVLGSQELDLICEITCYVFGLFDKSAAVSSSIRIINSTFDGEVDFFNTLFKNNVFFCGIVI